jgi:hypothetical protein
MNPLLLVSIALGLSMLANAFLGDAYLTQRDTATVAVVEKKEAVGAAVQCSKGTEQLVAKADERKKAAAPKREAAKKEAQVLERQADAILATPAAVPSDDCKSAQARIDTWWEGRGK